MSEREQRVVDRAIGLFVEAVAGGRFEQAEQAALVAFAIARINEDPGLESLSR